jgi:hypothetical protein
LTAGLFGDKAYAALSRRVGSAAELVRGSVGRRKRSAGQQSQGLD